MKNDKKGQKWTKNDKKGRFLRAVTESQRKKVKNVEKTSILAKKVKKWIMKWEDGKKGPKMAQNLVLKRGFKTEA